MKKRYKQVMIITLLLIIVALIIVVTYDKGSEPEFDTSQQNLATQVIVLPDGHHVLAAANVPASDPDLAQGWIGTTLTDLTSTIKSNLEFVDEYGVYVQDTYLESPAQIAGLLPGDILVKINNEDAKDVIPAINSIAALQPGNTYPFTVFRQGKYLDYSITVVKKVDYL